jgi:hypothetical protein
MGIRSMMELEGAVHEDETVDLIAKLGREME